MPILFSKTCYEKKNLQHVYEEAKNKKQNKTKNRWTLPTLIIRARARWHEHGERIKVYTNYFLTLQKRTHVKKHIRKLLINGSITSHHFEILICLASKNLNNLNIPSKKAFTIACTNQTVKYNIY